MSRGDGKAVESDRNPITFIIFGGVEGDVAHFIVRSLRRFLQSCPESPGYVPSVDVLRRPGPVITDYLDSQSILINEIRKVPGKLVLGVTDEGLYDAFKGRYIFGVGSGNAAIMSTWRFKEAGGGREKMKERLGKEAIKVLSLAVAAGSCHRRDCILAYHRHVEDLDMNTDVCPDCRKSLACNVRVSLSSPEEDD